jgi:hypothetical protein
MSVHGTQPGGLLGSYPEYVLNCRYDDEEDPSEITVFPGNEDEISTTEWITADTESSLALDEIR